MKTMYKPGSFWGRVHAALDRAPMSRDSQIEADLDLLEEAGVKTLGDLLSIVGDAHKDPETRAAGSWLLGRMGNRDSIPSLLSVLLDPHTEIRRAAVEAIGLIGHTWASVPLTVSLRTDPDPAVREAAAYSLGLLGSSRGLRPLLEAVQSDESPEVRAMASEQVGSLGDPRAVPILLQALDDPSPEVRYWSAFALGELGDPTVIPALESLTSDDRRVDRFGTVADEARASIVRLRGDA
jgi:HEAT repeat protein